MPLSRGAIRPVALFTAPLLAGLIAALAANLPAPVRAADEASTMEYICRPVVAGETGNAKMTAASETTLKCKPVSLALKMSTGTMHMIGHVTATSPTGPNYTGALTPAQLNDAWVKYIEETFHVQRSP
jgi:hypothetical protein